MEQLPKLETLSSQEKDAIILWLFQEFQNLKAGNEALRAENAELKRRLGLDSSNSSKPPSSDGPFKGKGGRKPSSLRGKSGKKSGGQEGHVGTNLKMSPNPDEIVDIFPSCCGEQLGTGSSLGYTARQEKEIEIKTKIATPKL